MTARWWTLLTRPRGTPAAGRLIRGAGVVALVTVVLAQAVPAVAGLVPFVLFTFWTNGPQSPVMLAAYEPVLMLYGRLYPPLLIGVLGTLASVGVEYLNYHVYVKAADSRPLRAVTSSRMVAGVGRWYRRAPFLTVVLCGLGPIPFWVARVLAALTRYSMSRYLLATAVGRFPRLWFFAALGALAIPTVWLVVATVGSIVLAGLWMALRAVLARHRDRRRAGAVHAGGAPCGW